MVVVSVPQVYIFTCCFECMSVKLLNLLYSLNWALGLWKEERLGLTCQQSPLTHLFAFRSAPWTTLSVLGPMKKHEGRDDTSKDLATAENLLKKISLRNSDFKTFSGLILPNKSTNWNVVFQLFDNEGYGWHEFLFCCCVEYSNRKPHRTGRADISSRFQGDTVLFLSGRKHGSRGVKPEGSQEVERSPFIPTQEGEVRAGSGAIL